jgi:hypothetical protein
MNKDLDNINIILIKILFVVLLFIPLLIRIYGISYLIIPDLDTMNFLMFQVFVHDIFVYGIILFLTYLSYIYFIPKIVAVLFRVIAFLVYIFYIIDIIILNNFTMHLNYLDIYKYIGYIPTYLSENISQAFILAIIFCIVFLIGYFYIKHSYKLSKMGHFIYIFIIVGIFFMKLFWNNSYANAWAYKNYLQYNLEMVDYSRQYTNEFKKNIKYKDIKNCKKGKQNKQNIIVLMVESFASYQSEFFSGINNYTPNLDKIAKQNIALTNFYSNGFLTEDAEISILTGLFPIFAPQKITYMGSSAFKGFFNIKNSLPNIFKKHGYKTFFVTSSDLTFSKTGIWAKSIGFDIVEGSNEKFYNKKQRYYFKAVEDKYLFQRVLQINKQNLNQKYFMFIKTVSSHIPFKDPVSKQFSQEKTIKYVDKQIGYLYEQLKKQNFFKDGILIIVGDHHPIIPITKAEIDKFSKKANMKVPMVVVSEVFNKNIIDKEFQQTDIYNSLKNFINSHKCTSKFYGDFLDKSLIFPKFIIHKRGDQRGVISVLYKKTIFDIYLNANNTKILNPNGLTNDEYNMIINKINYDRVQRGKKEFNEK